MFEKLGLPAFVKEGRENMAGATPPARSLLRFLLVYFVTTLVEGLLLSPFLTSALLSDDAFWQLASGGAQEYEALMAYTENLINTSALVQVGTLMATAALAFAALVLCRRMERRSFSSMGLRRRGGGRALGEGVGLAVLSLIAVFLFGFAMGGLSLAGMGKIEPMTLLFLLLGIFVKAFSEELLFRGCLMTSLARTGSLRSAVIVSAIAFAFLQRANAGVSVLAFVNLLLFGLVLSLMMVRSGSLWGSVALHALFLTGNVLVLGSPLYGMPVLTSLLSVTYGEGQVFLHGGAFGLLGGFAVTFALSLALVLLGMRKTNEE